MTRRIKRARTARLLEARLESLAAVAERECPIARRLEIARHLELASLATRNAVRLDLLSAEQADTIWSATRERHPALV